jgi:hypothetical protein
MGPDPSAFQISVKPGKGTYQLNNKSAIVGVTFNCYHFDENVYFEKKNVRCSEMLSGKLSVF